MDLYSAAYETYIASLFSPLLSVCAPGSPPANNSPSPNGYFFPESGAAPNFSPLSPTATFYQQLLQKYSNYSRQRSELTSPPQQQQQQQQPERASNLGSPDKPSFPFTNFTVEKLLDASAQLNMDEEVNVDVVDEGQAAEKFFSANCATPDSQASTSSSSRSSMAMAVTPPALGFQAWEHIQPSACSMKERTISGKVRKPRKTRTVFEPEQLELLEKIFKDNQYVVAADRIAIAKELALDEAQVKIWFQNRRSKWRRDARNSAPSSSQTSPSLSDTAAGTSTTVVPTASHGVANLS